jgi:hypothetical protein
MRRLVRLAGRHFIVHSSTESYNLRQLRWAMRAMTIGSPLFLQSTSARPARQVQLSARFKF